MTAKSYFTQARAISKRRIQRTSFAQRLETIADCCDESLSLTILVLPDDVLLDIFSHYVDQVKWIGSWYILVHVCQRWRSVVFSSSHRLHLQLLCTARIPVQSLLHVWPSLPLVILDHSLRGRQRHHVDNIIAALEHHDRVRHIELWGLSSSLLERFAAVTQVPFPELTFLELLSDGRGAIPVLPDPFFGGVAPRLHTVHLKGIHSIPGASPGTPFICY